LIGHWLALTITSEPRAEEKRMPEWMSHLVETLRGLSWEEALVLSVVVFVLSFVGSIAAVSWVLVKLPATYFHDSHQHIVADQHPVIRWLLLILKNLLGVALIVVGVLLSLPGVPGQGVLTILIGIMLLDLPGKRRMEQKLVSRPRVLNAINGLRARFGKPPLVL